MGKVKHAGVISIPIGLVLIAVMACTQASCGNRGQAPSSGQISAAPVPIQAVGRPEPEAKKTEDPLRAVIGKWVRPDGGYVLEIKDIAPDGTAMCAYLNPNPIRVSQAGVKRTGDTVMVFVELRDEGYPGCQYRLVHDQSTGQLRGVYYQAAVQETYDIYFVRLK